MNGCKVSIIIPIFNTAEYLRKCLDSCIYQTLSDIEIVAVVDGHDNHPEMEMLSKYEMTYPDKIRTIFLSERKGPGNARNEALRIAKGEYVIFVDGDDFIDFELCEKVFNALTDSSADIAVFDYYYMRDGILGLRQSNDFSAITNNDDIPFYINKIRCWFLMIKTALIVNNDLYFTGFYGEDIVTSLWYAESKKTIKINKPFYYYVYRADSPTSEMKDQKIWGFIKNYVDILKHPFCKSRSDDFVNALSFFIINYLCGYWLATLIRNKQNCLYDFCKILYDTARVYGFRSSENKLWESERIKKILYFYNDNKESVDFNEKFVVFYTQLDFIIIKERLIQLKHKLANKNIVLWAAGHYGEIIAKAMSQIGIIFEITNIDAKNNKNDAFVSWNLLRQNADVVLVTGSEFVKGVKLIVDNDAAVYDLQKYLNGSNVING